jgi:ATP-binding cassette subfamily B protein
MKHIWRIITFTGTLWPLYAWISFFTILLSVMSQLQPILTKAAIDEVSKLAGGGQASVKLVGIFAGLIFLTDLGQTIFSNIGGYIGDLMAVRLKRLLSQRYYQHLLDLPQQYFDTELSGKIINRMSRGISQIGDFMQMMSNNFLQFIFGTVLSLAVVAYYSWPVALMLLTLYPIFIWLTARTSGKWQAYQKINNQEMDIASGRFAESVGQVKVVKSFIQEARELSFFKSRMDTVVDTSQSQSRLWHRQDVLRRLVLNLIFLAVFAYIFIEAARGTYSIGTMVLLIQYAMLIRLPIFSISFLVDRTQRAVADSKDYFEVLDQKPEIKDAAGASALDIKDGAIEFDSVRFAYDKSEVLKGVSFTIAADSKVALVGESGEGKTTVTNLLLRLYEPQAGSILIDGQDIAHVTQKSLRSNIGVVFQEPALFSGTIRENITYADPDAADSAVIAAAKAANAHDFITGLDKGYDTEIGERGLKLSGGQKQRIAIARALLKDAPILVLDEATSSLDSKSEALVQEALEHLMKGRTTIIIAHRLSTIQNVDTIITLRGGTVDEIGSPGQLATSGGIYEQLLKLQRRAPTERTKEQLKQYEIAG